MAYGPRAVRSPAVPRRLDTTQRDERAARPRPRWASTPATPRTPEERLRGRPTPSPPLRAGDDEASTSGRRCGRGPPTPVGLRQAGAARPVAGGRGGSLVGEEDTVGDVATACDGTQRAGAVE